MILVIRRTRRQEEWEEVKLAFAATLDCNQRLLQTLHTDLRCSAHCPCSSGPGATCQLLKVLRFPHRRGWRVGSSAFRSSVLPLSSGVPGVPLASDAPAYPTRSKFSGKILQVYFTVV